MTRYFGLALAITTLSGVAGILIESPAAADSDTFSSATIGQSGSTPSFNQTAAWSLSWSYSNCLGGSGNFSADINGSSDADPGPNELGSGGSGTDVYYDAGTFNISVISECDWSITVAPLFAAPSTSPTFSNTQNGQTGQTAQFQAASGWSMSWSYSNCIDGSGNFSVDIVQPAGDDTFDVGPNELDREGVERTPTRTPSSSASKSSANMTGPSVSTRPSLPRHHRLRQCQPRRQPRHLRLQRQSASPPHRTGVGTGSPTQMERWRPRRCRELWRVSNLALNAPINHIVSTGNGGGYWLVAGRRNITEGDAQFYGSTGAMHLNAPVVDMAPTPTVVAIGLWLRTERFLLR